LPDFAILPTFAGKFSGLAKTSKNLEQACRKSRAYLEREAASMDKLSVSMTGQNSVMDWGLWLLLIGLVALYFWLAFRRRK
jgi:hypothetical protein